MSLLLNLLFYKKQYRIFELKIYVDIKFFIFSMLAFVQPCMSLKNLQDGRKQFYLCVALNFLHISIIKIDFLIQ